MKFELLNFAMFSFFVLVVCFFKDKNCTAIFDSFATLCTLVYGIIAR